MTIADDVKANAALLADAHVKLDAIGAAIAAIGSPPPATVDLQPVLAAVADVKAQLVPTPPVV